MAASESDGPLAALNRLLVHALLALADAGDERRRLACTLAASAWFALRRGHCCDAERFTGADAPPDPCST